MSLYVSNDLDAIVLIALLFGIVVVGISLVLCARVSVDWFCEWRDQGAFWPGAKEPQTQQAAKEELLQAERKRAMADGQNPVCKEKGGPS
jgi:tRNA splicing ligase